MHKSRLELGLKRLCVYALVVAITIPFAPLSAAAETRIDLDGNPFNGDESTVETNVLQSFPVEVENVIFNNTAGTAFSFSWPGAGPGGFESILTVGPNVGTKWTWTTVSQVFSIQTAATFDLSARELPVFGQPTGGIQGPSSGRVFTVPGKSILPSDVTLSSASLTSSLVTFFSPENTLATCASNFVPGRFEQTLTNNTGETVTFMVEEPDCCPEAQMTICDDGCQFYLTDENNCGGCGIACTFDEFCDQGSCADICPGVGAEFCDDLCVDSLNDDTNCGGCGITCAFDEFCDQGSCADICPGAGEELCGATCVDTFNDDSNCGGCGTTCAFDEFCGGGACGPICPGVGQAFCDSVCVDTLNDTTNCGACGGTCAFDQFCDAGACADICPGLGQELCNGLCVDTLNDTTNCGACGVTCAFDEFCDAGACADICPGLGQELCNGLCVDTLNDTTNCGACGVTCAFDEFCDAGSCADICPGAGQEYCSGLCVDTLNDTTNCGACGVTCAFDEFCDAGTCGDICPGLGQELCDDNCVDTLADVNHCGGCGTACAFDEFCDGGACAEICPGQTLCGVDCSDLASDPQNCGGCGNACDPNSICTGGTCVACHAPLKTNCNNECVNTNTDPYNCGGCGMVCDFSNCPSGGTGACSQGSSCICSPAGGESVTVYGVSPLWTAPPKADFSAPATNLDARRTVGSAPAWPRAAAPRIDPRESTATRADDDTRLPSSGRSSRRARARSSSDLQLRESRVSHRLTQTTEGLNVEEAPVCGIPMIEQVIADGESFTLCQSGGVAGREIFTTATVMMNGEIVGQGPCALIVPDPDMTMQPFLPSPVSLVLHDESGDGLLQPGETAEAVFEVLNLGSSTLLNPVAVLRSTPDALNPLPITLLQASSTYLDFPALVTAADCETEPDFETRTNSVNFVLSIPPDQEPDVGRLFKINFQGDAGGLVSVDMPIVIGIGRICDPATDLDGETYDGLEGLLSPINAKLVPTSYPANLAPGTFNHGSNLPLKLKLKCGDLTLSSDEIGLTPQIVSIIHETLGDLPISNINADNNANPSDPFFSCGSNRCEYGMRTAGLPVGTITVGIRMPDSRVFHVAMTTVP